MRIQGNKKLTFALAALLFCTGSGFSAGAKTDLEVEESSSLDLRSFRNYEREYKSVSIGACSTSSVKTYENYKLITSTTSEQYQFIHNEMTVDSETGFLVTEDGFIGAALGYSFGDIGSKYYFVLDTGIVLPIVKVDAKASVHATNGCSANDNASVIEFVIDPEIAGNYFGSNNGLVCDGNFNNCEDLQGSIVDVEQVLDEKIEAGVVYDISVTDEVSKADTLLLDEPAVSYLFKF